MAINRACPKCGGNHVQMSNERSKHGCLWTVLFGMFYFFVVCFKWIIGFIILCFYDWWMAIIKKCQKKGMFGRAKNGFQVKREYSIVMIVVTILRHKKLSIIYQS